MSDMTKAFLGTALLFVVVFGAVLLGCYMDHRHAQEMAQQGYVWVPHIPGHYEKK